MKIFLVAIALFIVSTSASTQSLSNHYQLTVDVDPDRGRVKSHCNLRFVADKETKEVTYWMNTAFQPIKVTGQDVDSVWFTGGLFPQISEVHIQFKDTLEKGNETIIDFDYEGKLSTDQFIDRGTIIPAWTELSVGAIWYPLSLEESLLTYEIALTAPPQYTVESAGQVTRLEETKWIIREDEVTPGRIILMLSDQFHKVSTAVDDYTVDFYVLEPADSLVDSLQSFTQQLLTFFDERFGAIQSNTNHMKIFFPNRDIEGVSNGGFSSNGKFIMLSNQRETNRQFRQLSHEIAHFWWRHGILDTYHEFLSEGLAEFSMLMTFQEKYGEERLRALAKYYKRKSKELGSIRSWDNQNRQERHPYLYYKGSLVMLDLLDKIGEEKLYAILRRTASEKVSRYEDFLSIIRETTDEQTAKEFDAAF